MLSKNKDDQYIDKDQRQNPLMTLRTVKFYCQKQSLSQIPQMNDKLYLQYKSFTKIIPQTISRYINVVTLYLNNNAISKIEGLSMLKSLKYLYLQHNFIEKINGLEQLSKLIVLNLSHNKIQKVENLQFLQNLQTLNLSKNFITHPKDIENLITLSKLSSLDLSFNEIECSETTFQILIELQKLSCLYLKSTPLSKTFKNYRKRFIGSLRNLKFLDDRPVLQQDHRLAEAWLNGGIDKQKQQKEKITKQKSNFQNMKTNQQIITQSNFNLENKQFEKQEVSNSNLQTKDFPLQSSTFDSQFQSHLKNTYSSSFLNCKYQYQSQKKKIDEKPILIKKLDEQDVYKKVQQVLGKNNNDFQQQQLKILKKIKNKWNPSYQKILQALLMKYKFDFSEVQPSFNMILSNISKKIMKPPVRYQISQLRIIWTEVEKRKRKQSIAHQKQNSQKNQ